MSEQTMQQEPQPFAPPPRPSWRYTPVSRIPRESDEGLHVTGVVSGLSRAYGFDVRSTRIAVAIASVIFPVIILFYLAAAVMLPGRPEQAVSMHDLMRDRRRLPVMIVIAILLVIVALGSLGGWFWFFHGVPWGLALIAIGVLLWVGANARTSPPSAAPTAAAPPAPAPMAGPLVSPFATTTDQVGSDDVPTVDAPLDASLDGEPDSDAGTTTDELPRTAYTPGPGDVIPPAPPGGVFAPTSPQPLPPARPPRRRGRPIGAISFLVAVAWLAFASLLEAANVWDAPAVWVIVTALLIVAIGLATSLIVNRNWLLVIPMLPVLWLIGVLSIIQPNLDGGFGERSLTPTTIEGAEEPMQLGAGHLDIDLTMLPAPPPDGDTVDVDAELGAGRLHVVVPADATLIIRSEIGLGELHLDDSELSSGFGHDDERVVLPAAGADDNGNEERTFVLDLEVGMGLIDIDRTAQRER